MSRKSKKDLNSRFLVPALGNELVLVEEKIDEETEHENPLLTSITSPIDPTFPTFSNKITFIKLKLNFLLF